jgi:hypothetical protein
LHNFCFSPDQTQIIKICDILVPQKYIIILLCEKTFLACFLEKRGHTHGIVSFPSVACKKWRLVLNICHVNKYMYYFFLLQQSSFQRDYNCLHFVLMLSLQICVPKHTRFSSIMRFFFTNGCFLSEILHLSVIFVSVSLPGTPWHWQNAKT